MGGLRIISPRGRAASARFPLSYKYPTNDGPTQTKAAGSRLDLLAAKNANRSPNLGGVSELSAQFSDDGQQEQTNKQKRTRQADPQHTHSGSAPPRRRTREPQRGSGEQIK